MSSELARYVLTLGFNDEDQARMTDLAARNQEGDLSLLGGCPRISLPKLPFFVT
jgi:hypothetical protein